MVVEHIHEIPYGLAGSRRIAMLNKHSKSFYPCQTDNVPLVDAAWINELLKGRGGWRG
jgi:hypothetical protein